MGSPSRSRWVTNDEVMEVDNLHPAFYARDNVHVSNDVSENVAAGLRINSRMFGSDPPPQNEVNDPIDPVDPIHLVHPVDPIDAVQYDESSSDSIDSQSSSVILMSSTRTTPRPGRFTESSEDSSEESLIGFPIDPPAGSPAGFPTESPMDSLASSTETSPESSRTGSLEPSPVASPTTSPPTSPTRSAPISSKRTLEDAAATLQTISDNPDEAFACSICLDTLTNTGSHKPACLKCGHIFGENCLQRWIKIGCNRDARRCPTCNTKASLKDIRVLYTRNLVAVDTAEITALELKVEQENRAKNLMHLEAERWKVKATYLDNEVKRLKTIVNAELQNKPSTSGSSTVRQCIKKIAICKNLGCRVMAFNKNNMMMVVSQHSDTTLFKSHVIRKMNGAILEPSKECIFAHKKQIRDMAFHPIEHNLLASVGLDKTINLTDLSVNTVVSSVDVPEPLWSCCWAGDNTNVLVAGGQTGSVFYIDRRYMKLFNTEQIRKPGCVSLNPLPPSSSRSFLNGGVFKTRMDFLSVLEQVPGQELNVYREVELPLKGLWTSSSYDSQSNLLLSSAKPCGPNKSVRHVVSKLADFNTEGRPLLNPVVTFYGGDKSTQLSRSCLVPPNGGYNEDMLACCFDERSSTIKVFNINAGNNVHNFNVTENFLDLCPLPGLIINGRRTMAGLSENAMSVFSV
uniref:RING-type E3 ubiquitin transferase n=1 Tax=Schizaphis graminum TaxID=13262 RepID=A0A2S2PGK9_SCHGA